MEPVTYLLYAFPARFEGFIEAKADAHYLTADVARIADQILLAGRKRAEASPATEDPPPVAGAEREAGREGVSAAEAGCYQTGAE